MKISKVFCYLQICVLNKLACFGLGENLKNRTIVAISNVQILQIPRYWILEKNVGNIWQRVTHYLDNHIPSPEEVFKIFVRDREWNNYKKKLIISLVKKQPINSYCNVPLSIRINHHPDTYYQEISEKKVRKKYHCCFIFVCCIIKFYLLN